MRIAIYTKQAFDRLNTFIDRAANHPLMDKIEQVLQYLHPERIKAGILFIAHKASSNTAVRTVSSYTDSLIVRAANSKAAERLEQFEIALCRSPGLIEAGEHLIAAARKP